MSATGIRTSSQKITNSEIFDWLVRFHSTINLEKFIQEYQPEWIDETLELRKDKPIIEGETEIDYKGILVLTDGEGILERLVKHGLVMEGDHTAPVQIRTYDDFRTYITETQQSPDGAYVLDKWRGEISRIGRYYDHGLSAKDYLGSLPHGFFKYHSNDELEMPYIGLKTRVAIAAPKERKVPHIEAFQIKRTAFALPLGMGKVVHFNKEGVVEEYFMRFDPSYQGRFIDPELAIVGEKHTYCCEKRNHHIVEKEKIILPSTNPTFQYGFAV